jgi:hypothetical protein
LAQRQTPALAGMPSSGLKQLMIILTVELTG